MKDWSWEVHQGANEQMTVEMPMKWHERTSARMTVCMNEANSGSIGTSEGTMHEWINEWAIGWVYDKKRHSTNKWVHRSASESLSERFKRRNTDDKVNQVAPKKEPTNEQASQSINQWVSGSMNKPITGNMDERMNEWNKLKAHEKMKLVQLNCIWETPDEWENMWVNVNEKHAWKWAND